MKVRATKLGYYGHRRRRPGDVFMISKDSDFSKNWMEDASKKKVEKEEVEFDDEPTDNDEQEVI